VEERFSLSKFNIISILIVAAIFTALFIILTNDMTPYNTGRLFGMLIALFLFPLFVAFITWLISGKKKNPKHIAFTVTLGVSAIGQFFLFFATVISSQNMINEIKSIENSFQNEVH